MSRRRACGVLIFALVLAGGVTLPLLLFDVPIDCWFDLPDGQGQVHLQRMWYKSDPSEEEGLAREMVQLRTGNVLTKPAELWTRTGGSPDIRLYLYAPDGIASRYLVFQRVINGGDGQLVAMDFAD